LRPDVIRRVEARSILSPVSGFLERAGFTHSLTPARNCTYGCLYCYVPTMRVQGGLQPEDWRRWGQFTTFKSNAAGLAAKTLRPGQRIYCSPLTDPYQPAEREECLMPAILEAVLRRPPECFVLQTRGPLILRDLGLLERLASATRLRVSFSITTDCQEIAERFEPHCETISERLRAVRALRDAGIVVHATLAPLLPCDPERLATLALESTSCAVIADPLHVRAVKPRGAVTREQAVVLCNRLGRQEALAPEFQREVVDRIRATVVAAGREFGVGESGFGLLAST